MNRHFMRHGKFRLNPRPDGERCSESPSGFFEESAKTTVRCATVSSIHYQPRFPHLPWKICSQVISDQVTRSGQVTLPPKMFVMLHQLQFWEINMELSGQHKAISSYKTYIFDFWFQWLKVRSILWPPHYKAIKEKLNRSYKYQICSFYHQLI